MKQWWCWKRGVNAIVLVTAIALAAGSSRGAEGTRSDPAQVPPLHAPVAETLDPFADPSIYSAPDPASTPSLADLDRALAARRWDQASELTWKILGQGASLPDGRQFREFPCDRLIDVDRKWRQASGGRYGFGVQRDLWATIARQVPLRADTEVAFLRRVGWDVEQTGPVDRRPVGYFPDRQFWATGQILQFGCGDADCSFPRTEVEETQSALDYVFPKMTQCRVP